MTALVPLPAVPLDLRLTLDSGQAFHWMRRGEGYAGAIGELPVYMEQIAGVVRVTRGAEQAAERYLALDHPLEAIYASFPDDPPMRAALELCRGLRILRQPFWECLATFITSSMKQVAHIAQMSHAIRGRFGRRLEIEGVHAYPGPEVLAATDEASLRACGLGYRAGNLLRTARMVDSGAFDPAALDRMDDAEALAELCRLPGVGGKVANCVLLFGCGRLGAFPIDVWIDRVLREHYFRGKRKVTAARLKRFAASHFGPYGGYAQQYLFHHARKTMPRAGAIALSTMDLRA